MPSGSSTGPAAGGDRGLCERERRGRVHDHTWRPFDRGHMSEGAERERSARVPPVGTTAAAQTVVATSSRRIPPSSARGARASRPSPSHRSSFAPSLALDPPRLEPRCTTCPLENRNRKALDSAHDVRRRGSRVESQPPGERGPLLLPFAGVDELSGLCRRGGGPLRRRRLLMFPLREGVHGAGIRDDERNPVVILLPGFRGQMRVDLLRDHHVRVAEDF